MMYDDIANNPRNPFKGNIINEIDGPNVYSGVRIDYRGRDVTPQMFLKVLQGQQTNAGTGRVLNTGPDDHIFIYYSDHGGSGFLHFPNDQGLYRRSLDEAFMAMHNNHRYGKLVMYVEACQSGSMFEGRTRPDIGVYVMTAANPHESSYGCCYDRKRKAFVGDQFSGAWMRDTEHHDIARETLGEQYEDTRRNTRHSHVQVYGDRRGMGGMHVGAFQGVANALRKTSTPPMDDLVESWDVPYQVLLRELDQANTTEVRSDIVSQLLVDQKSRIAIRKTLERIAGRLGSNDVMIQREGGLEASLEVDLCYEGSVDEYMGSCIAYRGNDYRFKDMHVFENLCRDGHALDSIRKAIMDECRI